jgi:hypothetical protein
LLNRKVHQLTHVRNSLPLDPILSHKNGHSTPWHPISNTSSCCLSIYA